MNLNFDDYLIEETTSLPTPALLLFPEKVKRNIEIIKSHIHALENFRPHIKTIKSKELIQLLIDEGVQKFKCATLKEARLLGELEASDVLIAYPLVGYQIDDFMRIIEDFPATNFQCIVENINAVKQLDLKAKFKTAVVSVLIDVNLGMGRTGVEMNQLMDFVEELGQFSNIFVNGFHGYDGHIRETDLEKRTQIVKDTFEAFLIHFKKIEEIVARKLICVFGGSNTFPIYAQYPMVECSPGTFMLWDWGYHQTLPEQKFHFAAVILSTVISKPGHNTICLDLGYKAIAAENPIEQRLHIIHHENWQPVFQSEEHLVLRLPDAEWDQVDVGNRVYVIPYHICPTVAWYPYYHVITNKLLAEIWRIAPRY